MGTIQTLANQVPATAKVTLFNWKTTMVAAGWTVQGSSDGSTFSNAGVDKWVTSANVVANAWIRLQDPSGAREQLLQFNGTTGLRVKYSEAAHFAGGSPSATQVPSATDEGVSCGAGTDAAPTYRVIMATDGTYHQQLYVDGLNAPYPFYCVCYPSAGGAPTSGWFMDAVDGAEAGDTSITTHYWSGSGSVFKAADLGIVAAQSNAQVALCSWLYLDIPGSKGFVTVPMLKPTDASSNTYITNSLPTSARNSKNPFLPILYARSTAQAAPQGYKGVSRLFRWVTVTQATPGDVQIVSAHDYQVAGDLLCTWVAAAGAWA